MYKLIRHLKRNKSGGVLIEVAMVSLLLMTLVIGMASVNIQISSLELTGRSVKEVTDIATQMIIEDDELSTADQEILLDMVSRRTRTPLDLIALNLTRVVRDSVTGDYSIVSDDLIGDYPYVSTVNVVNGTSDVSGIFALGNRITLDFGQQFLIVYLATIYEGVPRGIRSPRKNDMMYFSFIE